MKNTVTTLCLDAQPTTYQYQHYGVDPPTQSLPPAPFVPLLPNPRPHPCQVGGDQGDDVPDKFQLQQGPDREPEPYEMVGTHR